MNAIRTLVCGDIHGGLKAFEDVIMKANYDPLKDKLICLGDYVDGWPDSAEVISKLIYYRNQANSSNFGGELITIRGNHDVWCADWLNTGNAINIWVQQGGQATLDSYVRTGLLTEEAHKKFFNELQNYYIDDKNRGFVHGGFHSRKGLGHEVYQSDYYWDRDMWELAVALDGKIPDYDQYYRPNPYRMYKHEEIFIGHTSTTSYRVKPHYKEYQDSNQPKNGGITIPMNRCNVWNLDTGGGWSGKITIMDIDTKEYWQSDFVKSYYPNHHGR
jgi:serine/threonine protein phosphatase 1